MADTASRLVASLSDRYEIGAQIGQGGMATVFTAHDRKHNRPVAIKVLRPELAAALGTERFLREIQVAARLRHPHIIPLFDSGQIAATGDQPALLFYIMPRIEGESLRSLLQRETVLPMNQALKIASQVADALQHAHQAGVVHRDIKPENILLEAGHALVADFGISRALGALRNQNVTTPNLTETGSAIGTPAYMSPEQIEGRTDIDGKTDIYSLACVLFEMLSGVAPYTGPTPTAVAARHFLDPVPTIRQVRPEVPIEIDSALRRAMAKAPADRFATADQFNLALQSGLTSGARPALAPPRSRSLVIGILVLLALAGAFAVYRMTRGRPSAVNNTTLAILPFSVRGADTLQLGEGMVTLLGTKMDGAGDLRTVDSRALLSYLEMEQVGVLDPARARRIAQHFSAGLFILGEVVSLGSRLQVTARLYHHDESAAATSATEEGDINSVFEMVDRLAAKLLAERAGGASELDQMAGVSTKSLPAFRAYLDGESAMRTGRFDDALAAYQRATAADSNFALAWYRTSIAAQWLTRGDIIRETSRRAEQLSTQLPERYRQLLRGTTAFNEGELATAERIFRGITGMYPDDVEAWMQLAELLFHIGPLQGRSVREATEPFQRVVALEPANVIPLIHLARIAALERDTVLLDSLINRVRILGAGSGQTSASARQEELEMGMLQAVVHRDSARTFMLLDSLDRSTSLTLAITTWDVAAFTEAWEAAIRLTTTMARGTRVPAVRAVGYAWRGLLLLSWGQWNAAMLDLDSAASFDPGVALAYRAYYSAAPFLAIPETLAVIRPRLSAIAPPATPPPADATIHFTAHQGHYDHYRHYLVGLYAALAGEYAQAERSAATLKSMPGNVDQRKLGSNLSVGIRGEMALQQGDTAAALAQFEQLDQQISYLLPITTPFYFNARELYRRAQILEWMGRTEDALRWYAGLDALSTLDGVYLVQSLVKRGELSEQQGQRDAARAHYERVIRILRNPEPMFRPTLQKAREGLQRLSPSR